MEFEFWNEKRFEFIGDIDDRGYKHGMPGFFCYFWEKQTGLIRWVYLYDDLGKKLFGVSPYVSVEEWWKSQGYDSHKRFALAQKYQYLANML